MVGITRSKVIFAKRQSWVIRCDVSSAMCFETSGPLDDHTPVKGAGSTRHLHTQGMCQLQAGWGKSWSQTSYYTVDGMEEIQRENQLRLVVSLSHYIRRVFFAPSQTVVVGNGISEALTVVPEFEAIPKSDAFRRATCWERCSYPLHRSEGIRSVFKTQELKWWSWVAEPGKWYWILYVYILYVKSVILYNNVQ